VRKYHRWFSTAAMVFLLYVSVTGVLLAIDGVTAPDMGPPPPTLAAATEVGRATEASPAPMTAGDIQRWAAAAVHAAMVKRPAGAIQNLDLRLRAVAGAPKATVVIGGAVAFSPYVVMRFKLHDLLQDLHRGSIVGIPGQFIDVLTGVSLTVLSITGITMYLQMLASRRRDGRPALFWR
jgi:hypothetical protein